MKIKAFYGVFASVFLRVLTDVEINTHIA